MIGSLTHLIRGAAIRAILGGQEAINPARLALFSDWAETLPPRPLPRTVTPVPGEYYLDYIFRLADANHLEFLELTEALDDPAAVILDPGRQKQHQQERLAAAASQPLGRIARLHWDDPGDYLRDPEGFRQLLRPACRRCTARRGIVGPVACRLPPHLTVCRRHRLWIGPSARTPRRPLDVSPLPEILHASVATSPSSPPPVAGSRRRHQRRRAHHPQRPPRRRLDPGPAAAPAPARPRHLATGRAQGRSRPARQPLRRTRHRDRDLPGHRPARRAQPPGARHQLPRGILKRQGRRFAPVTPRGPDTRTAGRLPTGRRQMPSWWCDTSSRGVAGLLLHAGRPQ